MKRIYNKNRVELIRAARGEVSCDLVIKNANFINVLTGELYLADVGIYKGFVAHVRKIDDDKEPIDGKEELDAKGLYLAPGLMDAHIHIESSMLTPYNFSNASIPHGTTTVITDPHEIGNVLGEDGVRYMIEMGKISTQRQFIMIPSCIPSVPGMENAGATFESDDIEKMLELDNVLGLAELMDYQAIIKTGKKMMDITELAFKKECFAQGHAPLLENKDSSAYVAAGVQSDHEVRLPSEARSKIRNGVYIDAKYSSFTKSVSEIWEGLKDIPDLRRLTLCTDDREAHDILYEGHMNCVLKEIVEAGMPAIKAMQSATINVAEEIGYKNIGAIAPGYVADMVLFEDLKSFKAKMVFVDGNLVAKDGKMIEKYITKRPDSGEMLKVEDVNSVLLDEIKEGDLYMNIDENKVFTKGDKRYIKIRPMRYPSKEESHFSDLGDAIEFELDENNQPILRDNNLSFIAVIFRHNKNKKQKFIAIVQSFGIKEGALGSTVSHDSHNLTIVYDNPQNGAMVANDIINNKGGMSCVSKGEVVANIPMPIAGLLSDKSAEEVADEVDKINKEVMKLGVSDSNPVMRIATCALPVIPKVKITDMGMVDVEKQKFLPIFE